MADNRLPIHVVVPRETDYTANHAGGSQKPLCDFTEELRNTIETQCVQLQESLNDTFKEYPTVPCVAKIVMKEKAIAKSHKPTALFKSETCPIVGGEKLNEILVKVTPKGMQHLINTVKSASTKAVRNNLTKIEKIIPYEIREKIQIPNFQEVSKLLQPLKIKLFSFDDATDNEYYIRGFEELIEQLQLQESVSKIYYSNNTTIYKLKCENKELVEKLVMYPGVHKISFFPQYACDPPNLTYAQKQIGNLDRPVDGKEYPIVGLIDSGVSKNNPYLMPWIYDKVEYVTPEYQNNEHGTFVAGVIEYGNLLNGMSNHQLHYKILDVVVFPNNDPDKGPTDTLPEDVLIDNLHDVIGRYCV